MNVTKMGVLAVAMVGILVGCNQGPGDPADYEGDAPPAELVGAWTSYRTSDTTFQYYDPDTGQWSGNGQYTKLTITPEGGYQEIVILQTGAGTGCPSALYLEFVGPIGVNGDQLTLTRAEGKSIGEDCNGEHENPGPFTDAVYTWQVLDNGGEPVLAIGDPGTDPLLYERE